jgi:hypothetical protein
VPAVAAGRAAARDIFLPAKGNAAIAAVTGFYVDVSFINEHGGLRPDSAGVLRQIKMQRRSRKHGTARKVLPDQSDQFAGAAAGSEALASAGCTLM